MEKTKWLLYLSSFLLIIIPIFKVIITDVPLSSFFSHSVISTAILLVIIGKMITIFEKRKESKRFAQDIGVIIGLSLVLFIRLF